MRTGGNAIMQDPHPSRKRQAFKALSTGDICRLAKKAGLSACDLAILDRATKYGQEGGDVWFALFDFAQIEGEGCWASDDTLAARAGMCTFRFQRVRAALRHATLVEGMCDAAGQKWIWWPRHPSTHERLPAESASDTREARDDAVSADSQILVSDMSRNPASGPETRTFCESADSTADDRREGRDDAVSADSQTSLTDPRITRSLRSLRNTSTEAQTSGTADREAGPLPGVSTNSSEAGVDAEQDREGEDARLKEIPPRELARLRGKRIFAGRNAYGCYLLWELPRLKELGGSFFIDAPGALSMDVVTACRRVEARLAWLEAVEGRLAEAASLVHDRERALAALHILFGRESEPYWEAGLAALPRTAEAIERVVAAVEAYASVFGQGAWATQGKLKLGQVIEVMAEIPSPRTYMERLRKAGFGRANGLFHPNTLARAKREMESVFDTASSRNVDDYRRQLEQRGYNAETPDRAAQKEAYRQQLLAEGYE